MDTFTLALIFFCSVYAFANVKFSVKWRITKSISKRFCKGFNRFNKFLSKILTKLTVHLFKLSIKMIHSVYSIIVILIGKDTKYGDVTVDKAKIINLAKYKKCTPKKAN